MSSLLTTAKPPSAKAQSKSLFVILMGPPGAGKGTHAGPLSAWLAVPHISTGDLFRENMRNQTPLGMEAKRYIDQGQLVPDGLTLDLLFDRLQKPDCKKGVILDGFPRTLPQAEALEARLGISCEIAVLYFRVEAKALIERMIGRVACKQCGQPYHRLFSPPKDPQQCDQCQGQLFQRDDDKEEVVRKRLEVYHLQTQPVVDFYARKKGVLKEICSEGKKERIFAEVVAALQDNL